MTSRFSSIAFLLASLSVSACVITTTDGDDDDSASDDDGGTKDPIDPERAISGSVSAPEGETLDGLLVVACVVDASTGECDEAKSASITLSSKKASQSFDLEALVTEPCVILAAKDNNGNDVVDGGDLIGGVFDDAGQLVVVEPPAKDLTITLKKVPVPSGNVPAELVGDWHYAGSEYAGAQHFEAGGSWYMLSLVDQSTCITLDKIEIATNGTFDVEGNLLRFTPTSGTYVSYDCNGTATSKPPSLMPFERTFAFGVDDYTGKTTLTLTDPADPAVTLTYERD